MSIERIREALAAGPTPGEWACYDDSSDGKTSRIEIVAIGKTVARIYRSVPEQDLPNARLIAACHPENIRALLAEVERLRAAVTALVPIVEKERARLAINQQKAPERMASSYDGLIAPLDAALRLAGINMRSKE